MAGAPGGQVARYERSWVTVYRNRPGFDSRIRCASIASYRHRMAGMQGNWSRWEAVRMDSGKEACS